MKARATSAFALSHSTTMPQSTPRSGNPFPTPRPSSLASPPATVPTTTTPRRLRKMHGPTAENWRRPGCGTCRTSCPTATPDPDSDGLDNGEEDDWTDFLDTANVNSFAIEIGSGISDTGQLNRVAAFDGRGTMAPTPMARSSQIRRSWRPRWCPRRRSPPAISRPTAATVLALTAASSCPSRPVPRPTPTTRPVRARFDQRRPRNGTFNTATNSLTIAMASGGSFVIDLDDGNYTYTPPNSVSPGSATRSAMSSRTTTATLHPTR